MDPERQPLLIQNTDVRSRRTRPLTVDEVNDVRTEASWRRARFFLVLIFWAIMAMFLSVVACVLVTAPKCRPFDVDPDVLPAVPPVHMSFTPLMATSRAVYNDYIYTM